MPRIEDDPISYADVPIYIDKDRTLDITKIKF